MDAHLHLGWTEVKCDEIPPEGTMNENTHCVHGLTYWVVTRSGTSDERCHAFKQQYGEL